jgi:hypothetical protein
VTTFQDDSNNFVGVYRDWKEMAKNPNYKFVFPRYDDPLFCRETRKLVRELGKRYDGNPAISYMRVSTGKSGEDNPYGRIGTTWFTNHLWINYSRKVTQYYLANFRRTRLEFDVLWTAIVAAGAKSVTPLTSDEQNEAQEFIDYTVSKKIFIAFNGIAPAPTNQTPGATAINPSGTCGGYSPQPDATTTAMTAAPYAQIARLREKRIPFGLEGNALSDPCMAPSRISAILNFYRPQRVVFFGDVAALMNFAREGLNQNNGYEIDALTNVVVPRTKNDEFLARQAKAMPQIKRFAADIERLVQQSIASGN